MRTMIVKLNGKTFPALARFFSLSFYILIALISLEISYSQDVVLRKGGQSYVARTIDSVQVFTIEGREYWLVTRADLDTLRKRIRIKDAVIEHHDSVILALKNIAAACEQYEQAADKHIATQKMLIDTAEALYKGYKDLYRDVKKLVTGTTLSVSLGGGVARLPDDEYRPILSLGAGLNNWFGKFDFGSGYKSLVFGIRYGLSW